MEGGENSFTHRIRDRSEMHLLKDNKKNNAIRTTALIILVIASTTATITMTSSPVAYAWIEPDTQPAQQPKAPTVISGENVYIVWWTDKGTANSNGEVIFRASNEGGATFGDKINLSNTADADSVDAEIAAEGANVIVTWWERNQTSDTPVARISTDGGQTFGPMLRLAANGTIDSTAEEEVAAEAGEL